MYLGEDLPGRGLDYLFGTTNDEQNEAMRGINRKLGYIAEPPTVMYEKRIGGSVANSSDRAIADSLR